MLTTILSGLGVLVALIVGTYFYIARREEANKWKIKLVAIEEHHDDDDDDDDEKKKGGPKVGIPKDEEEKKPTFKPPQPKPIKELLFWNTVESIVYNFMTPDHPAIVVHNQAVVKHNYQPLLGYLMSFPYVVFSTPSAARVLTMNWKEIEKENTKLFSPDIHKFMGVNLVFANGDEWKRQRTVVNPAFFNIARFMDAFVDNAIKAVHGFSEMNQEGKGIIVEPLEMTGRLALDVLGRTVFGVHFNTINALSPNYKKSNESEKVAKALESYQYVMNNIANPVRFLAGKYIANWPLETNIKMNNAISTFQGFLDELIEDCKNKKDYQNNTLLKMMVDSVDEEGNGMTIQDIKNNTSVFFLAGTETTASSLAFIFYSLATNPTVQEKLYQEIIETFPLDQDDNQFNNYEKVKEMKYLDAVLKENLRLYPPVPQLPLRVLNAPTVIDGYKIPKGFSVNLSIYSIHRHPEVWGDDAESFRPERFLEKKHASFAWIPFGSGARKCLGNQFSMIEQKSFVIALVRKYKIELERPDQVLKLNKFRPNMSPDSSNKYRLVERE